jgi:hypothetical protein
MTEEQTNLEKARFREWLRTEDPTCPGWIAQMMWDAWLAAAGNYADAIRQHRDERGDDRCWQDDEKLYAALPEGYVPPARDTAVELGNCQRYIECRHNPATVYVSPQRRIEELEAALAPLARPVTSFPDGTDDGVYLGTQLKHMDNDCTPTVGECRRAFVLLEGYKTKS